MRDQGDDRAQVAALASASTAYLRDYSQPLIAAVRAGRSHAKSKATTAAGKRRVDAIRSSVERLRANGNARAARLSKTAGDEADGATRLGIGALIGSTALILLFGAYLLRRVVGPIRRVSSAADELAAGVLTARAPQHGAPELAQLGRSFNAMAATIVLGHLTILYIEDNLSNLRLVERALARHGTTTFLPAMQGSIGLELAREHRPDIILLDLHLPDMRGDEVLVRLKAEPATRDTPVVMLSADASPGQIRRLRDAGAAAYLTKPIDLRQLLDVVAHRVAEPRSTRT